jgi:hypothetical protein
LSREVTPVDITGVRSAELDSNDHTGELVPVQATPASKNGAISSGGTPSRSAEAARTEQRNPELDVGDADATAQQAIELRAVAVSQRTAGVGIQSRESNES